MCAKEQKNMFVEAICFWVSKALQFLLKQIKAFPHILIFVSYFCTPCAIGH